MCKKSSCIVPIILLIIIACLCTYIFLFTDCKCKDNNTSDTENIQNVTNDNNYTYKDIAGYYSAEEKDHIDFEPITIGYHLYLYENGTFYYGYTMNTIQSTIGNYTIVGNEIHLNYLFRGGSDASLTSATGSKTLIIEGNTITDNNAPSNTKCKSTDSDNQMTSKCGPVTITLEKDTTNNYNSNQYDVNYLINNYKLVNKSNE